MNRPITSPWSAVLTSSPTITFTPYCAAFSRASSAPEISLWSVTAIAPEADVARGREQHVDRRRAVVASGRCACAGRRRSACAWRAARGPPARGPASWRSAASSRVDRLDLVGDARPASSLRAPAPRPRAACAARRRATTRSSCSASTSTSPGSKQQAEVAVARAPPRRPAGAPRAAPRRRRAPARARRARSPGRARRRPRCRPRRRPASSSSATVTRSRRLERSVGDRAGARVDRSPPTAGPPAAGAARAGRAAAPPRSSRSAKAIRTRSASRSARSSAVDARAQQAVARGEEALSSSARGLVADAVRASIRPKNSSTNWRATWVESTRSAGAWKEPTLSAREWRSATDPALGAHGSCTCTKSSWAIEQHLLDRARDVDRRRRVDALAPVSEQQLADAEHAHAAVGVEQVLGRSRAARISLRDSRTSSGDRDGASSSTRCPRSASSRDTSDANVPTSFASSSGCGATCAMANRSATAREDSPVRSWISDAVLYQVVPRSFCDADGDGIGDLARNRRAPRSPGLARR